MVAAETARRAARIGGFVGLTAGMLAVYGAEDALAAPERRRRLRDEWLQRWSVALLRLFAVQVDVAGEVPPTSSGPNAGGGRMVVANHRSAIDIAILLRLFGGCMVSRADLSGWPLVGAAARKAGTVFVDRSSTLSGASAIRTMRALLRAGDTVLIFPEGTTFPDDTVRPFHPGGFIAALRSNAQIVPVGLAYERGSGAAFFGESFVSHLSRMAGAPPTRVVARIGSPLTATGSHTSQVSRHAHEVVQALVHEARTRCDSFLGHPPPTK